MGNICNNVIFASFPDGSTLEQRKAFLEELKEEFEVTAVDEEGLNEFDAFEVKFDSSWVAPIDWLQDASNKYGIELQCVAYDFTNGYSECFDLYPNDDESEDDEDNKEDE